MTLPDKIKHYGLDQKDWFQHKHYTILTRMGIDKIQAIEKIEIKYEAVKAEPEFCVVKAIGVKGDLRIETFGSAKYGAKVWVTFDKPTADGKTGKWQENGNAETWYLMEMAEKRAMSRAVLKITGFYELGVFGEDESEDFKKENPKKSNQQTQATKQPIQQPSREVQKPIGKLKMKGEVYQKAITSNKADVLTQALTKYDLSSEQIIGISKRIAELKKEQQ